MGIVGKKGGDSGDSGNGEKTVGKKGETDSGSRGIKGCMHS